MGTEILTSTTSFSDSQVAYIKKELQELLRAGLAFTPRGSVIPATFYKPASGIDPATLRSFAYEDLAYGAGGSLEDGQVDPTLSDLGISYVEISATAQGGGVAWSDQAEWRSPFNLPQIISERVARSAAMAVDYAARSAYLAGGNDVYVAATEGATVASDIVTAAKLLEVRAGLVADNVKPLPSGTFAVICHPNVAYDIRLDDAIIDEMKHADPSQFLNGEFLRWGGLSFIETSLATPAADGSASINVYPTVVVGAAALFAGDLASTKFENVHTASASDPFNRKHSTTWQMVLGADVNTVQSPRYAVLHSASSLG